MVYKGKCGFWFAIIFVLVGVFYASELMGQELYIIGGKDVPALSEKELKDLFVGFKSSLPTGRVPVLLIGREVREIFTTKFLGMPYSGFKAHWMLKALAGKGVVPSEFDVSEVIKRVKASPGAIGVVSEVSDLEDVKILLKIK